MFLAPLAPLVPVLSGGATSGGAAAGGIAAGQVLRTVAMAASGISLANPVGIAIVAGSIAAPIVVSKGVAAFQAATAAPPPPPPSLPPLPPPGFFLPSGEEIALEQMITILKAVKKVLDTYETLKEAEKKDQSPLIALLKSELEGKIKGDLTAIVLDPKFLRASLKIAKNIDNNEVEVFGKRLIKALK